MTLSLAINDDTARSRAAALLGPAGPGVSATEIRFHVSTQGTGSDPKLRDGFCVESTRKGSAAVSSSSSPAASAPSRSRCGVRLQSGWQEALDALPSDWSDVVAELELDSSVDIDRAAVLCAPINPSQTTERPGFRFRSASAHGYGASAGMAGRCLARLDEAEITGRIRVTRALSDVHPVGTQGATFLVGRRPA